MNDVQLHRAVFYTPGNLTQLYTAEVRKAREMPLVRIFTFTQS